jgi:NADPH2:quinone reductase
MKAVIVDEYGGPEVLKLREVAEPEIADDQVLVKVRAAGVNPVDWKIREGYVAEVFACQLPLIPGWDMAGIVERVGEKVQRFKPGDEVYAYSRLELVQFGTYAEYSPAYEHMLARKPENLDFSEAATIPLAALTAWQALVDFAELKQGESVFITAGSGGVGGFAIQIAKHLGAKVCAASSAKNHEYMKFLGADHLIDYQNDDIEASVKSFAVEGVDVVFDCTGRENVAINFDYLKKPGGRMATINGLAHTIPELDRNADLHRVRVKLVVVEPNGEQLNELTRLIEDNSIEPLPFESLPLEQAAEAQNLSQAGHVRGKIALIIS